MTAIPHPAYCFCLDCDTRRWMAQGMTPIAMATDSTIDLFDIDYAKLLVQQERTGETQLNRAELAFSLAVELDAAVVELDSQRAEIERLNVLARCDHELHECSQLTIQRLTRERDSALSVRVGQPCECYPDEDEHGRSLHAPFCPARGGA